MDLLDKKIQALKDFQQNAEKYTIDAVMDSENIVLDMVFEEQLATEGVNGNNVPIMDYEPYSPATIFYKKMKGQPTDRVTTKDEGDFHSAGELIRVQDDEALVISTDKKSEGLQDKYGKEILYLKPDNVTELKDFYIKPYLHKILSQI